MVIAIRRIRMPTIRWARGGATPTRWSSAAMVEALSRVGDYQRDPAAIYRESFAVIRREARLHHLPPRVGQLESHVRLPGNGLDHADRHHRQRAREILDEVDDLSALHADRGLDFVARDHGPGIRREDTSAHAEVRELPLDETRGEVERLVAHRLSSTRDDA